MKISKISPNYFRVFAVTVFLSIFFYSPAIFSEPMPVEVGVYVLDVSQIDIKDNRFFADFYIWFKWKPGENLASWSPDSVEFMNGSVESPWEAIKKELKGGDSYWIRRFKGTFRARFRLQAYPFDAQILPIIFEDNDAQDNSLVFIPSKNKNLQPDCLIETSVQIPGWRIDTIEAKVDSHLYETDFGETSDETPPKESGNDKYSRFTVKIRLERYFFPHLIKFAIPLLVIAGMAYMVFYISEKEFGPQCAICITSLLSSVALHASQANALPAIGYLVVADKIFILFYFLIFSALLQTVVVDWYSKRGNQDLPDKLDKLFRICYPLILLVGVFIIFKTGATLNYAY